MQSIKEHLKTGKFKPIYLLYGTENYLKQLYKKKLKNGILSPNDTMNYSYFEGKSIDYIAVKDICDTLPFFSEQRLVILENTGLFKHQNDFSDYLKKLPATTHIVFVETEVDKRSKLYKTVKTMGTVTEMNGLDEKNLKLWVASVLKQNEKKITEQTISYFLDKSGSTMDLLSNEIEKLVCYTMGQDVITTKDIDAVCTTQITGKIFQMIDAIAAKRQKYALELYYDLLSLREKPMSILFLITRHFNLLLHIKNLAQKQTPNAAISKKAGVPPFAVAKYLSQSKNFSSKGLMEALQYCTTIEENIKTGLLTDQIGVELLIVKFSQNQ